MDISNSYFGYSASSAVVAMNGVNFTSCTFEYNNGMAIFTEGGSNVFYLTGCTLKSNIWGITTYGNTGGYYCMLL